MPHINFEHTTTDSFVEWLDNTPRYAWEIVETAARVYSIKPQQGKIPVTSHLGGMCRALQIMSGYPFDVIAGYIRDFAADNYSYGERIA